MVPGSAPVLTCHPFVPWPFVAPPCPTQWQTWAMAGFKGLDQGIFSSNRGISCRCSLLNEFEMVGGWATLRKTQLTWLKASYLAESHAKAFQWHPGEAFLQSKIGRPAPQIDRMTCHKGTAVFDACHGKSKSQLGYWWCIWPASCEVSTLPSHRCMQHIAHRLLQWHSKMSPLYRYLSAIEHGNRKSPINGLMGKETK